MNGTGILLKTNDPGQDGIFELRFELLKYDNGSLQYIQVTCENWAQLLFEAGGYKLHLTLGSTAGLVKSANFYGGREGDLNFPAVGTGNIESDGTIPSIVIPWIARTWDRRANKDGFELHVVMEIAITQMDNGWSHEAILHFGVKSDNVHFHKNIVIADMIMSLRSTSFKEYVTSISRRNYTRLHTTQTMAELGFPPDELSKSTTCEKHAQESSDSRLSQGSSCRLNNIALRLQLGGFKELALFGPSSLIPKRTATEAHRIRKKFSGAVPPALQRVSRSSGLAQFQGDIRSTVLPNFRVPLKNRQAVEIALGKGTLSWMEKYLPRGSVPYAWKNKPKALRGGWKKRRAGSGRPKKDSRSLDKVSLRVGDKLIAGFQGLQFLNQHSKARFFERLAEEQGVSHLFKLPQDVPQSPAKMDMPRVKSYASQLSLSQRKVELLANEINRDIGLAIFPTRAAIKVSFASV
ncbi:hypothetical protein FOL47_010901 [Perkinsus chesapeaki]|uniref:Uncharacterized protein n=1 Tax=Perkinsus chesapeaki TaxID=330153 RepID=A0A7J6L0I4_PERCH|nr:hypothetical protein FOL47_010901 [Perkinsus chesapeaki]